MQRGAASTSGWCCGKSDSGPVFHAGRSHVSALLRAGVKMYERRGAMLHAKTATIDGVWSCVGSTNLDWRRFLHNDELDATILGREFAAQMQAAFASDLLLVRRAARQTPNGAPSARDSHPYESFEARPAGVFAPLHLALTSA